MKMLVVAILTVFSVLLFNAFNSNYTVKTSEQNKEMSQGEVDSKQNKSKIRDEKIIHTIMPEEDINHDEIAMTIRNHYELISQKKYIDAWELLSEKMQKEYPRNEVIKTQFGIQSVKISSIEKIEEPKQENIDNRRYIVKLLIEPNKDGTWISGLNDRSIRLIKSKGKWVIDEIYLD